jgi:hypothetical protein
MQHVPAAEKKKFSYIKQDTYMNTELNKRWKWKWDKIVLKDQDCTFDAIYWKIWNLFPMRFQRLSCLWKVHKKISLHLDANISKSLEGLNGVKCLLLT